MKLLNVLRVLAICALGLLAEERATAQNFSLSISNSPNPVALSNNLTYTITVTNLAASGTIFLTNNLPPSVQFVSGSNSFLAGFVSNTSPGVVVFELGSTFAIGNFATLTLNVTPTFPGLLTNLVTVGPQGITNVTAATNVTQVNVLTTSLGLSIAGPTAPVIANDWMTYSITVTNGGSNSATGVVLSNTLPAGVNLISVMPTNPPFILTNGAMVFNLGTLTSHAATTLAFTVQPTVGGVTNTFVASAGSSRSPTAFATNNVAVGVFDTNQLIAVNFTPNMVYDPQTGLMKQTIQLSNVGTNTVAAARVIVSGLTNVLFNAVGTNAGNPFVLYNAPLAPGQNVNLILEYFVPTRTSVPVPNSAYTAVPVPASNLTPPGGTPFAITLVTNLPSGFLLIEFQSTPGRSYTVLYADNPAMTNALAAQPVVVAPADRVQWIDDGPPKTISAPTNAASRFYKVLQNP